MDRPIIFSAPMVRALLDGRKTQTRRLATSPLRRCEPGDRLYVRESGVQFGERLYRHDVPATTEMGHYWVRHTLREGASYNVSGCSRSAALCSANAKVRPSIHMPRWASRLTLTITDVRVEQLQSIGEADAIAEGMSEPSLRDLGGDLAQAAWSERQVFERLWSHLHGGGSWIDNPSVVALTFRVERGNIDAPVPA